MGKIIAAERQKEILKLLSDNGSVKIGQLAEIFKVSKETIRRDLDYLSEMGYLERSHGGATSIFEFGNISTEKRISKDAEIKKTLCEAALQYLPTSGVIYLDSGSTIAHLAKLLAQQSGCTIITPSLTSANILASSNNTIIIIGGQLNPSNMSTEGFQNISFINNLKVSISFLGTNGFEDHGGPASSDFSDAQTKQAIVPNSNKNIVISDSSKATMSALIQYTSWRNIDVLITDSRIPPNIYKKISEMTEVLLVDV